MERGWSFPARGFIKVNVHALTLNRRLPNGNELRDDMGTIIKMYSGKVRDLTIIGNDLWSIVVGLREIILEQEDRVELVDSVSQNVW